MIARLFLRLLGVLEFYLIATPPTLQSASREEKKNILLPSDIFLKSLLILSLYLSSPFQVQVVNRPTVLPFPKLQ
ncbi:hypothetical protein GGR52DRAFT_95751 [Hypoxylon sp. FL1284]|nr:hypothetical protein GGR52DRAFT_95751 [Hypoxylon sp. FL1284]